MRDPNRIDEFCEVLKDIWYQVPDWRFGQLMSNALGQIYAQTGRDIFYIEDDEMLRELQAVFSENNREKA